jgi:glycosyltransferase involved in cell wall biosynthesis
VADVLRVLLVVDTLDRGGAERHVVDLALALTARGHRVVVACSRPGPEADRLAAAGIEVRVLARRRVKRRIGPRYAARLRALVVERAAAGELDLVHAHVYASEVAAAWATRGTGVPLVLTDHTAGPWRGPVARLASRWAYRRAGVVVAVSSEIRRLLLSRYRVPPGRVRLVVPAVPPPPAVPGAAPPWPADGRPVVAFAGRLQPEKGVDVLLRAVAGLPAGVSSPRVVVLGSGPRERSLRALAPRLRVADRVLFAGYREDCRALLPAVDVLVVPSRTDGSPLVALEAMQAGVPVVASAVGGLPDRVRDGIDGLLVPPDDPLALAAALARLLADPDLRARMGAAARRHAAQLSWHSTVDAVLAAYGDVLRQPRLGGAPDPSPAPTASHIFGRTGVV